MLRGSDLPRQPIEIRSEVSYPDSPPALSNVAWLPHFIFAIFFYLSFFPFHVRFQPKKEMLSLNISRYSKPSAYRVSELPKPRLANSKDVIIKVYAAGINPIDVKRAAGALKLAVEDPWVYTLIVDPIGIDQVSFPYKIGYDCSGIITETGRDVKKFNIGDAVYVKLPEVSRGEYK